VLEAKKRLLGDTVCIVADTDNVADLRSALYVEFRLHRRKGGYVVGKNLEQM
jgi:hypothetical protein